MKKSPEMLRKWANVLESGKYKKGRNCLRTGNEFCCLGVYCDAFLDGEWKYLEDELDENENKYSFSYHGLQNNLRMPDNARDTVGLSEAEEEDLMSLNDRSDSFSEIVKILRNWANESDSENA